MRGYRRTPSILWIPFVFSVGAFSWALLIAALGLLAGLMLARDFQDVRQVEAQRNNLQATLDLLEQKVSLQQKFMQKARTDPLLMERLASRQLHLENPEQEVLVLDPKAHSRDRSVATLLSEALTTIEPKPPRSLPLWVPILINPALRPMLILAACVGLILAFLLDVRYVRAPR